MHSCVFSHGHVGCFAVRRHGGAAQGAESRVVGGRFVVGKLLFGPSFLGRVVWPIFVGRFLLVELSELLARNAMPIVDIFVGRLFFSSHKHS